MEIRIKIFFLLALFNLSVMQDYEDEYEDIYEPQCDLDFDGEIDCDKFLSFASTNWHDKDYIGCIEQYKTAKNIEKLQIWRASLLSCFLLK